MGAQNAIGLQIVDAQNANGQAIVDTQNAMADQHNAMLEWLQINLCQIYEQHSGKCDWLSNDGYTTEAT